MVLEPGVNSQAIVLGDFSERFRKKTNINSLFILETAYLFGSVVHSYTAKANENDTQKKILARYRYYWWMSEML